MLLFSPFYGYKISVITCGLESDGFWRLLIDIMLQAAGLEGSLWTLEYSVLNMNYLMSGTKCACPIWDQAYFSKQLCEQSKVTYDCAHYSLNTVKQIKTVNCMSLASWCITFKVCCKCLLISHFFDTVAWSLSGPLSLAEEDWGDQWRSDISTAGPHTDSQCCIKCTIQDLVQPLQCASAVFRV